MDPFEFQSSSQWGMPDFSRYPMEPVTVSPEDFLARVEETLLRPVLASGCELTL